MKKALFIVLGVVAACFILGNLDYISQIYDAAQTGATIPLLIAVVIMIARHITQAVSYRASFEAVDFRGRGLWEYIVLIFSLVFINTFCLFSGATGVAFIIDDAHRKGADLGRATSGAILSQIGYFAAVLVISVIGFVTMIASGNVNAIFVTGALVLAGTLGVLSSLYVVGYYRPNWLFALFDRIERLINRLGRRIHKQLGVRWGENTAESFIQAAHVMAGNPQGTAVAIAWASLSALLNMLSLVAIGFAFGFENVSALIAAFALGVISVVVSPTPQGIGVVEAAIAAVLTAYGCSLATATAIALVYRGIMFWIPFGIGAVLLSQSGFFKGKKDPTQEQRDTDVAWIAGTLVGIVGLVSIVMYFLPAVLAPYNALVSYIDFSNLFAGPQIMVFGLVLVLMAVGLVQRYRTVWALATMLLVLIAGAELLFYETIGVAVVALGLAIWMFAKRDAFDRQMPSLRLSVERPEDDEFAMPLPTFVQKFRANGEENVPAPPLSFVGAAGPTAALPHDAAAEVAGTEGAGVEAAAEGTPKPSMVRRISGKVSERRVQAAQARSLPPAAPPAVLESDALAAGVASTSAPGTARVVAPAAPPATMPTSTVAPVPPSAATFADAADVAAPPLPPAPPAAATAAPAVPPAAAAVPAARSASAPPVPPIGWNSDW